MNQSGYLDWIKPDPGEDGDPIDGNGTEPQNPEPVFVDSDGDGWSDEDEIRCGSNPNSPASYPIIFVEDCKSDETSVNHTDTNQFTPFAPEVFPEIEINIRDTDGDGWANIDEFSCRTDGNLASSTPIDLDGDGQCEYLDRDDDDDGFLDREEIYCASDKNNSVSIPSDSDRDGICDGKEVLNWYDENGYRYGYKVEGTQDNSEPPHNLSLFQFNWNAIRYPRILFGGNCSIFDYDNDFICDLFDRDLNGNGLDDLIDFIHWSSGDNTSCDFPFNCSVFSTNHTLPNEDDYLLKPKFDYSFLDGFYRYSHFEGELIKDYLIKASNLSNYNSEQLNESRYWYVSSKLPWKYHLFSDLNISEIFLEWEVEWEGSDHLSKTGGYIWEFEESKGAFYKLLSSWKRGEIEFFFPIKHAPSIDPFVIEIDLDFLNDPDYSHKQWYYNSDSNQINLNLSDVWEEYSGFGVDIGILEKTGVQHNHSDLIQNRHPNYQTMDYDFCHDDSDARPDSDDSYHGTAVAGLALARGNNSLYIAGAAYEANLISYKFSGDTATQCTQLSPDIRFSSALNLGINDTDIIISSTSLLSYIPYPKIFDSLNLNTTTGRNGDGSIIVVSAGNNKTNTDNSNYNLLANSRFTIAVGSVNGYGISAAFSEPGSNVLVSALSNTGGGIISLDLMGNAGENNYSDPDWSGHPNDQNLTWFGGTSASAPMVGGIVGLMLEANSNLTWRDVQEILVKTTTPIDENSSSWATNGVGRPVSHQYGFGLVDAGHAVFKALNWTGLPEESNMSAGQYGLSQTIPGNDQNWTEIIVELDQTDVQPHKHAFFMESAEVHLDIEHQRRGDLEVRLISPFGTESILSELYNPPDRPHLANGSLNWTFTTVHNWGENALFQDQEELAGIVGKWIIKIRDNSSLNLADGILRGWSLHLHGHEGTDSDGDGYSDYEENRCNSNASDSADYPINTDGLDWCDFLDEDDDNDGWSDTLENDCGTDSLSHSDIPADLDGDWICDSLDDDIDGDNWLNDVETNCSTDPYSEFSVPIDTDRDGICDLLDLDIDGDSFNNTYEIYCLTNPYHSWNYPRDFDGDGLCDNLDEDDDNDSWNDTYEIDCLSDPFDNSSIPLDNDGGGLCDALDNDDDNDLIPDWLDANPFVAGGIEDWLPPRPPVPGTFGAPPPWMDSDDDGVPDWQDPDYWYDEDNSDYPEGTDMNSNPPPWVEGPR